MKKKKISELAKEFNLQNKHVMEMIKNLGIEGKSSASSSLDEKELDLVLDAIMFTHQVEDFSMYAVEKKVEDKPKKDEKSVEEEKKNEQEIIEVIEKPIEKKVRHIDTRQNTIDESRLDDTKIEQIMQGTDIYATESTSKQKIKKGGKNQRFERSNNKFNKNNQEKKQPVVIKPEILKVKIPDEISVGELAERLKKTGTEVIKKLMGFGVMASLSQTIDYDTAYLIAEEFGAQVEKIVTVTLEEELFHEEEDRPEDLKPRPPVVVVMGHVDHGKTSLLDTIRNTDVTATEAGGITQHIGAYKVKIGDNDLTFLDTPGHEAFTAMRARGAKATDIAILVVAADDGIMPQTVEAINHAKAADISIVVAINKMDKETANPDKIRQELTEYGLVPEEWGGDTICVPVSAKTKMNIDKLLETVLLIAELKELKANPDKAASGIVIEAKLDKGRGPVATVLVQNGTLHAGDIVVAGTSVGKVRAMNDYQGKAIRVAGPSVPVEILGLNEAPTAGDVFKVVNDEKKARQLVEERKFNEKEAIFNSRKTITLDNLFSQIAEGEIKDLNLIVKADVQGSVEAVTASLEKLSNEEVRVKVIHGGVGTVTESDILLASASNALIIGFNVRPDNKTMESAKNNDVDIRLYRVIYQAIEEVEAAMKGMLAPKFKESILGHAEIRNTFKVSGVGTIAGCYVQDGKIVRNSEVRIVRDGVVIYEGALNSLKRFKDDAKEVASGYECGMGFDKYNDLKEGDVIECFVMEEIKP
ncbi:MAG: translation initiation factor IF-2 [Clostridia bacterium]|nr:translation initiation factor IF-2 [Clostridia bacterium]